MSEESRCASAVEVLLVGDVLGQLRFRLRQQRLIAREVRLSLVQRGVVGTRIDGEEQRACLDVVAFVEADFLQRASDLGADADGRERLDVADRGHVDRHVLLDRPPDHDRDRRAPAAATSAAPTSTAAASPCRGSARRPATRCCRNGYDDTNPNQPGNPTPHAQSSGALRHLM